MFLSSSDLSFSFFLLYSASLLFLPLTPSELGRSSSSKSSQLGYESIPVAAQLYEFFEEMHANMPYRLMVVKSRSGKEDQRDLHCLDKRSTGLCDGFDG
jgi:hypothetical protein